MNPTSKMTIVNTAKVEQSQSFKTTATENFLVLVDQAIVSATSFLTMVLIGRGVSKEELGIFAFGTTLVLMITTVYESLIGLPYVSLVDKRGDRRLFTGSSLIALGTLSLAASGSILISAAIGLFGYLASSISLLLLAIGLTLPFILLRLFIRRICFSKIAVGSALGFDASISLFQICFLCLFFYTDLLGGTFGHLAIGLSCAFAVAYWLVRNKYEYVINLTEANRQIHENWTFSKSVFTSQLLWILHINAVIWSITYFLGSDIAGEFTASLFTILLANPFVLGLLNILTSRAVKSFDGGGFASLRNTVFSNMLLMVSGVVVLWLVLMFYGDSLVVLVFGKDFSGQQLTISILGISMIAETVCKAPEQGLNAIERPDIVSTINLVRLVVTILGLAILLPTYGIIGAASTLAIADAIAAIFMISSFVVATSHPLPVRSEDLV